MDEDEIREFNRNMKAMKRQKSQDGLKSILSAFGKVIPKGVHNPNRDIRNLHLYVPGKKHTGKTILYSILVTLFLLSQFMPFLTPKVYATVANPDSILIDTVRVFQNVQVTGDVMAVIEYEVNYAVSPTLSPTQTFLVSFNDGVDAAFTRPLDYYGHFFSVIYLASYPAGFVWGSNSTIQVAGNPTYFTSLVEGTNQRTLVISSGNWITGTHTDSPGYLQTWLLSLANAISPATLLTTLNLLTPLGSQMYLVEIPTLVSICPALFTNAATYPSANLTAGNPLEQTSLLTNSGARLSGALNDLGTFLHIPGLLVGGFGLALMYFVLAGRILIATGSVPGAIVLGIPFIFAGNLIGILPLSYTFIATFMVAMGFGVVVILGRMG